MHCGTKKRMKKGMGGYSDIGNQMARRESHSDEKRKPMKKGRMVYGMGGEVMPQAKPN
jgi:hypothetical protein